MSDPRRVDSVKHLQTLYSAVVGLALATAMAQVVDVAAANVHVDWRAMPVLVGFLVTLVPFYHGALRHLDDAYVHGSADAHGRSGLLFADFVVLFIESCLLFALAAFVVAPMSFTVTLLVLLAVDTAWGRVFHHAAAPGEQSAELTWARVNAYVIAIIAVLLVASIVFDWRDDRVALGCVVLVVAAARSALDYGLSWDFYFPSSR